MPTHIQLQTNGTPTKSDVTKPAAAVERKNRKSKGTRGATPPSRTKGQTQPDDQAPNTKKRKLSDAKLADEEEESAVQDTMHHEDADAPVAATNDDLERDSVKVGGDDNNSNEKSLTSMLQLIKAVLFSNEEDAVLDALKQIKSILNQSESIDRVEDFVNCGGLLAALCALKFKSEVICQCAVSLIWICAVNYERSKHAVFLLDGITTIAHICAQEESDENEKLHLASFGLLAEIVVDEAKADCLLPSIPVLLAKLKASSLKVSSSRLFIRQASLLTQMASVSEKAKRVIIDADGLKVAYDVYRKRRIKDQVRIAAGDLMKSLL